MADTKITALAAITTVDPAADVLPIVDVSDTSMAASGTTKKITSNQILGAGGIAALASATITGDLTARNWFVTGGSLPGVGNGNPFAYRIGGGGLGIGAATETGTTAPIVFYCGQAGVEQYRIAPLGVNTWSDGAGGTRMTLNSTGLGVGVTPSGTGGCLQLKSGITFPATQVASSDANTLDDYEEGTFTPTIQGATTSGVGTYTAQNGRYTKVGNLVTFQVFIDWTAHTGAGNMRIGNLPFTNGGNFWAGSVGYSNGIALSAGFVMTGYVESGQSWVTLQQYPTGGGGTTGIPMDTAGAIIFSASYTV